MVNVIFFCGEFKLDAHVAGNFKGFLFPLNSALWVIEQKTLGSLGQVYKF